jgi:hypothetical protein
MINIAAVVLLFFHSSTNSSPAVPSLSSASPVYNFTCILLPPPSKCVDYCWLHVFGLFLTNF